MTPASASPMMRGGPVALGDLAHGRDNNFQLLRFLAATAVILFHSYALTGTLTEEPLWRIAPELDFGSLGVKCFFAISGFLVTQSWLARRKLLPFAAARALRIYPALIVAVVMSLLLASWSTPLSFNEFMGETQSLEYLWRNASGFEARDQLVGVYAGNPYPRAVNGSLWTLPLELRLYIVVAIVGALGLFARRELFALCLAVALALFLVVPDWFFFSPNTPTIRQMALLFAFGSLAYVCRATLPISLLALCAGLAIIVVNPLGLGRGVLFAPLLVYGLLGLAYHPALQLPRFNQAGDYSYGLYVYSFPIQQTVVRMIPDLDSTSLFALSMLLTLPVAALSWHLLEKPMLGLKARFHFKAAAPLREAAL
jgi:peptidoglycan/LPS O-acetylase OafA/YrhL